ncbi:unnamed protein product, partial [Choristocarpus tenellus]
SINEFPVIDTEVLAKAQHEQYEAYFQYLADPTNTALSSKETVYTMSYCFTQERENRLLLYRSYQPGHLRKKGEFRDQLVAPTEVQG